MEQNDSAKMALYQQMDQLVVNDAPVVPLWYDEVFHLIQPGIKSFGANGLNLLELRRVKK
jgi:oligopeptide transport system substrate-binding protein